MKASLPSRLAIVVLLLAFAHFTFGDILDRWTQRSNVPVNRVRYCGGMFVAVGTDGTILTSRDGVTWTSQNSGTTSSLHGVTYGSYWTQGNRFVAVGRDVILISSNAITWSSIPVEAGSFISDIVFGTRFVAVGWPNFSGGPSAWYHPKLMGMSAEWGSVATPSQPGAPLPYVGLHGVGYGNGRFVAVSMGSGVWTSIDAVSWTFRGGNFGQSVAYGKQRFVAVSTEDPPSYSTNAGTTWYRVEADPTNYFSKSAADILFEEGRFVAIGWAGLLLSTNGIDWNARPGPPGLNLTYGASIAYGAGTFVTAAPGGVGVPGIWQSAHIIDRMEIRRPASGEPVQVSVGAEAGRGFSLEASSNLLQWAEIWRGTNSGGTPTQYLDWSVTNRSVRFYRALGQ